MKEICIISICICCVAFLIFIFSIGDVIGAEKIPKKSILAFIVGSISGIIATLSVLFY